MAGELKEKNSGANGAEGDEKNLPEWKIQIRNARNQCAKIGVMEEELGRAAENLKECGVYVSLDHATVNWEKYNDYIWLNSAP